MIPCNIYLKIALNILPLDSKYHRTEKLLNSMIAYDKHNCNSFAYNNNKFHRDDKFMYQETIMALLLEPSIMNFYFELKCIF